MGGGGLLRRRGLRVGGRGGSVGGEREVGGKRDSASH